MLVAKENHYDYLLEDPQYKPKQKVKKSRKAKKKYKTKYITITLIGFTMALIILFQYAKLNNINQEIAILENNLQDLNMVNDSINRDVLATENLEEIERIAVQELGMVKPTSDQITIINTQAIKDTEVANTESRDAKGSTNIFKSLAMALDFID